MTPRLYTLTQGRTSAPAGLGRDSLVIANPGLRPAHGLQSEHTRLLGLCQKDPMPVAELSGRLHLPVQTVKILIGDLLDVRLLVQLSDRPTPASAPDVDLMERVLAGLERY
ncbi:DUF742 domain-containing protein [Streptomyces yaizuensis]|uniref:DUF742 domain-containing protein n=1 Tax=Streptomyces yaizuensis TaxID=2989713 RepID=A0ABQ5P6B1_9ACTN|nr:DUF742 domain-containing protein [Streptomyces sp. YSPA8]GLF98128.1 DUF742 domain-containing protein [Streptomyces sp. YSPA8]